jgi:hypothetical protein
MPAAYFVVRAIVTDAEKRAAFDRWYETERVIDAVKAFGVAKAWRFWSRTIPRCTRRCISSMTRPSFKRC